MSVAKVMHNALMSTIITHVARSGHVINLSSTSGLRGLPCSEYYTASKFALEGIMDSMR